MEKIAKILLCIKFTKLNNLIKNLKKANQRLKEVIELKPTRINKDATIQRFEFTLAKNLSQNR